MDLFYAILDDSVVALTYADGIDQASDQIEVALLEEGIVDTDGIQITRFPQNSGTIVLDLNES
jgi:hypothetical protein